MNVDYEIRTKVMNVLIECRKEKGIFDDLLEKGSVEDVRTAIKSLIDRIEIDGENVYIYWSFD